MIKTGVIPDVITCVDANAQHHGWYGPEGQLKHSIEHGIVAAKQEEEVTFSAFNQWCTNQQPCGE